MESVVKGNHSCKKCGKRLSLIKSRDIQACDCFETTSRLEAKIQRTVEEKYRSQLSSVLKARMGRKIELAKRHQFGSSANQGNRLSERERLQTRKYFNKPRTEAWEERRLVYEKEVNDSVFHISKDIKSENVSEEKSDLKGAQSTT